MKPVVWSILFLIASVAGCAARQPAAPAMRVADAPAGQTQPAAKDEAFDELDKELADQAPPVNDPIEKWNRAMFGLNDALYVWVARPVLQGYEAVVPKPARTGIRNVFDNVGMPARAVNCLLQGKTAGAGDELRRFAINSTVGILGVRDAAQADHGLAPVKEDLGQTLAVHGAGDGGYLVWPIFGPATVRSSVGSFGDQFLNPLRYVPPAWLSGALSGLKGTNEGTFRRGQYESLKAEAVDPYVAMREAYTQIRKRKIQQ